MSICLPASLSPIYLSLSLLLSLSLFQSVRLSICISLSVTLRIFLSLPPPSISLAVCLSLCLSVSVSVSLSVSLSISLSLSVLFVSRLSTSHHEQHNHNSDTHHSHSSFFNCHFDFFCLSICFSPSYRLLTYRQIHAYGQSPHSSKIHRKLFTTNISVRIPYFFISLSLKGVVKPVCAVLVRQKNSRVLGTTLI